MQSFGTSCPTVAEPSQTAARCVDEPNWQARIAETSPTILAAFFNAIDHAAQRYDLDDDPVYHEATRQLAA